MVCAVLAHPTTAHAQEPQTRPESPSSPTHEPDVALDLAKRAFEEFRFARIREILEPQLIPRSRFDDRDTYLDALALLGVGIFIESETTNDAQRRASLKQRAQNQFLRLLREDPDYELDSQIYASNIVEALDDVRESHRGELDEIRADRGPVLSGDQGLETIYIERRVREKLFFLNFYPFGIGQFQNGESGKGIFLATTQTIALGTNVGAYLYMVDIALENDSVVPRGEGGGEGIALTRWRNARGVMFASLALFALLYTYSVIDGIAHFEKTTLEGLETLPGPPTDLAPETSLDRLPAGPRWLEWTWRF